MLKRFVTLLLVIFMLFIPLTAMAEDNTIVEIAVGSGSFSILVAALQKAELVDALSSEGPFTVFAPTDDAFIELLSELGITADDLLNHPQLADVLLYHVVSANILSTDLSNGQEATTLNGETITVSLNDGVFINFSEVISADIIASNGVIHVIDKVLVPQGFSLEVFEPDQNIVEIAIASDIFTVLVAALQKATLVDALLGDGPFTVFAPTDEAFLALLADLGIGADDLLNHPQLADVLLYHVVSGKILSSDLVDGAKVKTLGGGSISISLDNGVFINDSEVIAADIDATNGVIHVIDAVLVPDTFVLDNDATSPATGDHNVALYSILALIGIAGAYIIKKKVFSSN